MLVLNKRIIAMLPITKGQWVSTSSHVWEGLYFMELVFDWSILPPNSYGKLYAEILGNREVSEDHIAIRLSYQQKPQIWIPVVGSEIVHKGIPRWQLLESMWFKLPREAGVSCLWIEGKTMVEKGACRVALVTLVIAEEITNE